VLACDRDVGALCGDTPAELDLHQSIASFDVPTVIVGSEDDELTALSLAPHVEEIIAPGCGHMSLVTHPAVVTDPIRGLVRDPVSRAG
jgi:pimeloyl-ACP methyl ester carboxylesterase